MGRFIITENRELISNHKTLQECVCWIKKQKMGLHSFYIEDLEDEIAVHADDVLQAFHDGERPKDLQFF